VAATDSAANQFGAPVSAEEPARHISVFRGRICPSPRCRISEQESYYEDR
jgi:hypothetical protein